MFPPCRLPLLTGRKVASAERKKEERKRERKEKHHTILRLGHTHSTQHTQRVHNRYEYVVYIGDDANTNRTQPASVRDRTGLHSARPPLEWSRLESSRHRGENNPSPTPHRIGILTRVFLSVCICLCLYYFSSALVPS